MPESASATARALARQHLTAQITATARRHLARVGPAELSLRAVARDLGMASSAVYRYVESRDQLLTLLLIESYDELGAQAEQAEASVAPADIVGRWMATCRAVRRWALNHPHDYALLYGSPVPGYVAPADTVPPASRVTGVFLRILADLANSATTGTTATHPAGRRTDASTRGQQDQEDQLWSPMADLRPHLPAGMPARLALQGMTAWCTVFGTVSFELFGHLVGSVTDGDAYADAVFAVLAEQLMRAASDVT